MAQHENQMVNLFNSTFQSKANLSQLSELNSGHMGGVNNFSVANESTAPASDYEMNSSLDNSYCDNKCMSKYWALEAYLCILLVATIAANCMSIFKLYKQSKRSVTSAGHDSNLACFVGLNLSSINLAVGILVITPLVFQLQFEQVLFGRVGCQAFAMLFNIYQVGTPLFMVLNATERFIAIVYPLRLTELITRKRLRLASAFIWLVLAAFGVGFMLGSEVQTNPATNSEYCIVKLVGLSSSQSGFPVSLLFVVAPILMLAVLYGFTCRTLLRSVGQFRRQNSCRSPTMAAGGTSQHRAGSQQNSPAKNCSTIGEEAVTKSSRHSPKHATNVELTPKAETNAISVDQMNTPSQLSTNPSPNESQFNLPSSRSKSAFDFTVGRIPSSTGTMSSTPNGTTSGLVSRNEAVARRYRATCLLLLTVISHSLLCLPFIVNQFLGVFKDGIYPETAAEEMLTLFCTPILVTSSAVVPLIYLSITKCNTPKNSRRLATDRQAIANRMSNRATTRDTLRVVVNDAPIRVPSVKAVSSAKTGATLSSTCI